MKTSDRGLDLIRFFEQLRLTAYRDAVGVLTIGYGHTANVREGQRITEAQADAFLAEDVSWAEDAVLNGVTTPLTQNQFDALVSLVFNIGAGAFATSTIRRLLNAGLYREAAEEFPRWRYAKGKVLAGLVNRRAKERELFLEGTA